MFFRQLATREATLSYLFGCGSCHVAVAVDPVLGDEQWFIDEAAKQDVKITHVIDTHVHADHYSGGRALAEKTGAKYCLHEANAGLIAISEIMRAVLDARAAGVPVIALVGGSCGAFGGMGIVAKLCSAILISEEGRLALSGPEVIETVAGVEEFDSKDRALVWRVTGGKHRYLMGDCALLVDDDIAAFRRGATEFLAGWTEAAPSIATLRTRQRVLENRLAAYGALRDGLQVWAALGVAQPEKVPLLDRDSLVALKEGLPT